MSEQNDTAFEMASSNLRYGPGVTAEVGMDLADLNVSKTLVVTDPNLANLPPVATLCQSLEEAGVDYDLYDRVRIEPTDDSFKDAIAFARRGKYDAFVAIGGGSTMDTCKAANLFRCYPADFLDYVNPPIGRGLPVPGPLKPMIAIPTTAGTGSETTGVAVFDWVEIKAKTGISHRRLKPMLGIIDPENTKTLPSTVAAATGLDVLCHAVESFTAIPYNSRPKPSRPSERPAYQGRNPISDIWSIKAMQMTAQHIVRAATDPSDDEMRGMMLLAAAYAGMGFGNAGVHLPHAMSYPVSGMVREYRPADYVVDHPMVPHGMSVILNAPAVFRFTGPACPKRHLEAARALGADISGIVDSDAGETLASRIIELMRALDMPNGLSAIGFEESDISALVQGTLTQRRLTQMSPVPVGEKELTGIFKDAMRYW